MANGVWKVRKARFSKGPPTSFSCFFSTSPAVLPFDCLLLDFFEVVGLMCQEGLLVIHLQPAPSNVLVSQKDTDVDVGIEMFMGRPVNGVANPPKVLHSSEEALDRNA